MLDWLLTLTLALSPDAPAAVLPAALPPPSPEQVLAIPEPMRQALQAQVIDRTPRGKVRLERMVAFMFAPDGLGITYRHDANHTVSEVWATREANCLSFTLLTVALAREAGMDATAQEIERTLAWYSEGDTLYFTNHVNAGVHAGRHAYTVDVGSDSVMSLAPPQAIDDQQLVALYYSNRAADMIGTGDLEAATRFLDAAITTEPGQVAAWNNAGVVKLRKGQPQLAERDFIHALEIDPDHDGALMNLASLYEGRGDEPMAARYRRKIEQARLRNPFHYFMLAVEADKRQDHAEAARLYRRAIKLHSTEHRFHFGLARAYLHLGESRKAGRALRRAHELSEGDLRVRYQAKLDRLRQELPGAGRGR